MPKPTFKKLNIRNESDSKKIDEFFIKHLYFIALARVCCILVL